MQLTTTFIFSLAAATLTSGATIVARDWKEKAITTHGHPLCRTQTNANIDDISASVDRIIQDDPNRTYGQDVQITGKRNVGGSDPGIMLKIEGSSEKIGIQKIKYLIGQMATEGKIGRCGAISLAWPSKDPMRSHGWLKIDYTGKVTVEY
ncbi:hypothetical protein F5X96DRAFT_666719 [Biscogniauxia mediterranea]|nr:hypothetical protein F5X96DRAFT_666719 [Biscogniauxia mediterranea]